MTDPDALDLSSLDPRRDRRGWERLIQRVLRESAPAEREDGGRTFSADVPREAGLQPKRDRGISFAME